jgi:hypothetical protein
MGCRVAYALLRARIWGARARPKIPEPMNLGAPHSFPLPGGILMIEVYRGKKSTCASK